MNLNALNDDLPTECSAFNAGLNAAILMDMSRELPAPMIYNHSVVLRAAWWRGVETGEMFKRQIKAAEDSAVTRALLGNMQ